MNGKPLQSSPRVSVFISSYNHARFLPECLDSILSQTYRDFEIVVVDDGSSDNSHDILSTYQDQFPDKIRYFWHPGHANKGISISCNFALEKTRGEYLAWCGSDDVWEKDKLDQQVRFLDANPEVGLVYGRVSLIDSSGNALPGMLGTDITSESNPAGRLLEGNWIPASTAVIRQACLEQVGVFDENLVYSDWDLWIRVVSYWKAGFIPEIQARYRLHSSNVSAGIDLRKDLNSNIKVLAALREKAASDLGLLGHPHNQALIQLWLAYHYFRTGEDTQAAECLRQIQQVGSPLQDDTNFLKDWFEKQARQNYCYVSAYHQEKDFMLKVLEFAESGQLFISADLRRYLIFLKLASFSIFYYQKGDRRFAMEFSLKCLLANPVKWLRYRTLVSIFIETLIGGQAAGALRRAKQKLFFLWKSKNA